MRYQEAQALFLQQREEISEAVAEKEAIARQLKVPREVQGGWCLRRVPREVQGGWCLRRVPREGVCRVLCRVLRGTFNSCEML